VTAQGIARILVIDDEPQIRRFLRISLNAYGYEVIEAVRGEDGIGKCATESPDLVILDLGLPDLDGQEVIARIREWSGVPIIVLSVRAAEDEKVAALDHGADDYVTKPFGIHELLARVRASLRARRQHGGPPLTVFKAGELTIDLPRRRVHVAGSEIKLSRKEFAILRLLAQHAGAHRHPSASAARGLGPGARARDSLPAHLHRTSAPKARRRSRRPALHQQRTRRRLSSARG
jgi:two-component system, OmpR family, KDP operon response regulator KdpE